MGQEVSNNSFTDEDLEHFSKNLREETKILMSWFKDSVFEESDVPTCGLEAEAWLVDNQNNPTPKAHDFLNKLNDHLIVPEISKFNFEMNTDPFKLEGNVFSKYIESINHNWKRCVDVANTFDAEPLMIGSLPTIKKEDLCLDNIYPNKRYMALNDRVLSMRKKKEIMIEIAGEESISEPFNSILFEAAATSFQIHLQVNQNNAKDFYNASVLASAPMCALGANSPFLFGKKLWNETRIAIFEKAVSLFNHQRVSGRKASRVTLGAGYIKNSLFDLFLENLDGYPPLLPDVFDDNPNWLTHLRLHNGTIWRWNRPIIGINKKGKPHLRIEHRVPSAGPTSVDMIANMAFYIGVTHYLVNKGGIESICNFEESRNNFYQTCQNGFNSQVIWNGNIYSLDKLLLEELIPNAKAELVKMNIDLEDLDYLFDKVLKERVSKKINGSNWQLQYIDKNGRDFQALVGSYLENQKTGQPIHTWNF